MKKSFIPLTALALLALVSCGGNNNQNSSSSPASSDTVSSAEDVVNSISITNKDDLSASWPLGSADRTVNIAVDPAGNVNALISSGKITVTSSDPTIVAVVGRVLQAKAAGSATITVAYGSKTDSVDVTVTSEQTAIDLYGTVHAGTLADPLDNADALKVAEKTGETETEKYFYVSGTVDSFRDAPSSYGNVSYYLTKGASDAKSFLVYRAVLDQENFGTSKVTENDIWIGAEVVAKVKIVNYKSNTPETSSGGTIVSVKGTKPEIKTIDATVEEALTAAKALGDNKTSTDKYAVTGYIVATDAKGFYLSDTKGEITPTNDNFYVYGYSGDNAAKCTLNAKIKVTAYLQHYVSSSDSTKYNYQTTSISSLEILEEGDAPVTVEEIDVAKALEIGAALADNADSEAKYAITGYVVKVTYEYSDTNKNMSFTLGATADATETVTVYKTSLADGTASTSVVGGSKVKVTGYIEKYVKDETTTIEVVSGTTEIVKDGSDIDPDDLTVTDATVAQASAIDGGLEGKKLYRITGIIEGLNHTDAYGNAYLTDPETGKTVQVYGLTGTDDNKVFDTSASTDSKFFVNPKDAVTSLADVNNGDEVTVRVAWCVYNSKTEIFGVLESHKASTNTYTVGLNTPENGTVTADKTAYAYGETVTLTVTPSEGYEVKSVVAKDAADKSITVTQGETGYTFAATCVNNVTVTFDAIPEGTVRTVTWDCTSGAGPSAATATDTEFTATIGTQSVKMGCVNVKAGSGYMFLSSKTGAAYAYSKDALPGSIQSITIKVPSGASADAVYSVVVGSSALSEETTTAGVNVKPGSEYTFTFDSTGSNYFQIANYGSKKNGQVATVTITYDTAK